MEDQNSADEESLDNNFRETTELFHESDFRIAMSDKQALGLDEF